jgi:hypothetical protein
VGEDVRLVACDNDIVANPLDAPGIIFQQASFNTNEWTGDQADASTPTFDGSLTTNLYLTNTGGASFFAPTGTDEYDHGCVAANISSLHAGLDEVTLNVYQQSVLAPQIFGSTNSNAGGFGPNLDPTPVYSKQFVVIWMTANTPKLTEASLSSLEYPSTAGNGGTKSTVNQLSTVGQDNVVGATIPAVPPSHTPTVISAFLGDTTTLNTFPNNDTYVQHTFPPFGAIGQFLDANITPTTNNGLIQVNVTGSFPIEDQPPASTNYCYFASVTGEPACVNNAPTGPVVTGTVTLPDDWVKLADLMATSSTSNTNDNNSTQPNGPDLWDIHGGPTNPPGHSVLLSALCSGDGPFTTGPTPDAVDDCATTGKTTTTPEGDAFSFSRVFGDMTDPFFGTVGPYDPLAPNASLLSDGRLNSDDAPMPALPVTVSIAPGGLGGLYGVSKWMIYSHDFNTDIASPLESPSDVNDDALTTTGSANFYNPFYQAYIPSTLRPVQEASGVTGVYEFGIPGGSGTDFPGFSPGIDGTDPYTYWTALDPSSNDPAPSKTGNGCLRGVEIPPDKDTGIPDGPIDSDDYYQTPDYPTSLMVYTDERGEAYVDYNPGNGFYKPSSVTVDNNSGCDLQNVTTLGTSDISAQVEYPYESVPYFPPASANAPDTITKTVLSKWSKTVEAYPKLNASGNVSIIVATATDVNGNPFVGETVCFSTSAGALLFDGDGSVTTANGVISLAGSTTTTTPASYSPAWTCGITGTDGTVAIEDAGSTGPADVLVAFVNEHLFRDVQIPVLGQTTPVPGATPTVIPALKVTFADTTGGSSDSSSAGSSAGSTSGGTTPAAPTSVGKVVNLCKVATFHVYKTKHYATVKVSCTQSKTDKVMLRTYNAKGRLLHTYRATLAVNKLVKIKFTGKFARITVKV